MPKQPTLFEPDHTLPAGLRYQADLLSAAEETELVQRFAGLPFKEFEFHGFTGKRRVMSFGWQYDFNGGGLRKTGDMPDFLPPVREGRRLRRNRRGRACARAADRVPGRRGDRLAQGPRGVRARRRPLPALALRLSLAPEGRHPLGARLVRGRTRSAYLLQGSARSEWEHSIPAVERLRYSVTFRSLKGG